jgi:uncharacterized protein (TIGR00369 family)
MDLIDDKYCFVCGTENETGLHLTFSSADGRTVSEFVLPRRFQGYKNVVHGGIASAILDEVMVHAAMSLGLNPVTAEMNVRFKSPLYVDMPLRAEAEVVNNGPRMIETAARIIDRESNKVLAEANGKLIPLKRYP